MASSTKMRAGDRRSTIKVERHNGNTRAGEPTYDVAGDWAAVTSMEEVPAQVMGVAGGSVVRGLQMDTDTTYLVEIGSTPRTRAILSTDRITWNGKTLNINRILDRQDTFRDLTIQCKD